LLANVSDRQLFLEYEESLAGMYWNLSFVEPSASSSLHDTDLVSDSPCSSYFEYSIDCCEGIPLRGQCWIFTNFPGLNRIVCADYDI